MSFNWKEYFNLALVLQGLYPQGFVQEAAFRCSVSRAYYAAYCYARNNVRDNLGFTPTHTGRDHGLVREHFRSRGMTNIASKLDSLYQWRGMCDYNDTVSNISIMVKSAIIEAREIIGNLP